jgi:hypothetical protein
MSKKALGSRAAITQSSRQVLQMPSQERGS